MSAGGDAPALKQEPHQLDVAVTRRQDQRRGAMRGGPVHLDVLAREQEVLQHEGMSECEETDHADVSASGRPLCA